MSGRPNHTRPHHGKLSQRAIRTWKDGFNGHVHAAPDSNLPTTNLPPEPNRNQFSLGSSLRRNPALGLAVIEDYELDGQLSHEQLQNYSVAVWTLAQKSDVPSALITHA